MSSAGTSKDKAPRGAALQEAVVAVVFDGAGAASADEAADAVDGARGAFTEAADGA